MKKKSILLLICVVAMLAGCKPTEKNYQDAYLAAQNKKKAEAAADADMGLPANALQSLDGTRTKNIDGEQLRVKHLYIKYAGKGEAPAIERVNVAVAKYRMPTNAIAQTEDLENAGFKAFPAEASDGSFYVIVASFPTFEEASDFVKKYKKDHAPASFVGLDGAPLLIER